jgi:hypothetical protein
MMWSRVARQAAVYPDGVDARKCKYLHRVRLRWAMSGRSSCDATHDQRELCREDQRSNEPEEATRSGGHCIQESFHVRGTVDVPLMAGLVVCCACERCEDGEVRDEVVNRSASFSATEERKKQGLRSSVCHVRSTTLACTRGFAHWLLLPIS